MFILSSKQVLSEDKAGVKPLLSSKSHLAEDKTHNEVQPGMTMDIKVRNDDEHQSPE